MISYKKLFHIFVFFLFISFLVLYFSSANGYYEDLNSKKSLLTEDKIKEFEKDIKDGKKIDVENYIVNVKKDYSNIVSDFGLFTSNVFAKYFKKGMTKLFGGVDKMVND